jgi:hypothetical protein
MGKYIGSTATIQPTQASAGGVYTLKDQLVYNTREQWPVGRDPYFNYTTLLLQGDVPYTRGRSAMTLPLAYNSDASSNNFLLTPNGDVGPRPFSPYFGGNYSSFFNALTDGISASGGTAFALGTADFTVECWIYPTTNADNQNIMTMSESGNNYFLLGINTATVKQPFMLVGGTQYLGPATLNMNAWNHIAAVKRSNSITVFTNGVAGSSASNTTDLNRTNLAFIVGRAWGTGGGNYYGYVSNARLVKGTAVYTSNFTPPIDPLQNISGTSLLACQANRFIDNSTANSGAGWALTVTGTPRITDNSPFVSTDSTSGSAYFDGTGDSLSNIGTTTSFNVLHQGTPKFTIEAYVYVTTTISNYMVIFDNSGFGSTGHGITFDINNSGYLNLFIVIGASGSWVINSASTTVVPTNQWVHVAATYDHSLASNNLTFYINGTSAGSFTKTANSPSSSNALYAGRIGSDQAGNYAFQGYISNLRITNTVASAPLLPTQSLTANSNTLLLTLQTRAPSQNINFIDSSPNEFLVTKSNTVTQGTFSPYTSSWSNYFNGSSGITLPNNANYGVAANTDFCWEAFIYMPSLPASAGHYSIWNNRNAPVSACGWQFGFANVSGTYAIVGTLTSGSTDTNVSINLINQSLVTANQWHHIALARNNGVIYGYWNGVLQGTLNYTASINAGAGVSGIGWRPNGYNDLYFNGYISNFRFVNGSAVYPGGATFTVPTTALAPIANTVLLTAASNRFIDLSTQNATISLQSSPSVQPFSPHAPTSAISSQVTGGSGYFSSGSLTIPHSPVLNLNSVDFCIEAWVYLISAPLTIAQKYVGGNVGSSEYYFAIDGTNQLSIAVDGGGGEDYFRTSANTVRPNAWNHCVVTRVGNDFKLFINGVLQNYSTSSRTLNATSTGFTSGGGSGNYISSVRITKGTIPDQYKTVATTTGIQVFTPPTGPLASIPGTQLLLNFTNGAAVDATGRNVLESVGNVHTTRAQAKFDPLIGGSAIYFDGSDYLTIPDNPLLELGSGDFTIEAWIYPIATASNQNIFGKGTSGQNWWAFYLYTTSLKLEFAMVSGNTVIVDRISNESISLNTWTHVAVCRSGSTFRLFINGIETSGYTGSPATSSSAVPDLSAVFNIGANRYSGSSDNFNGYIQNLRVTKYARYTTNFNTNLPAALFPRG